MSGTKEKPVQSHSSKTVTPHDSSHNHDSSQSHAVVFGPDDGPKYRLGKKVGGGSFGVLRLGKNLETNEFVAVKLEPTSGNFLQLATEWSIYQILGSGFGFPRAFYYGQVIFPDKTTYNALVMELLDLNLEAIFEHRKQKFNLKTVLLIVIQTLKRMEYVHGRGLIYRDVKPENFVIGRDGTYLENVICLIDFGMSKPYIDPVTGNHIPFQTKVPPSGTLRYMSTNCHRWREMSRRDDLEALGYVYVYFMKGQLPWSGLKAVDADDRFVKVGCFKETLQLDKLCKGIPEEFGNYLKTVRDMKFEEAPNYVQLRKPFEDLLTRKGFVNDNNFEWKGKLPHRKSSSRTSEKPMKKAST